jgi:GntR family transcriptional regulator, transcriptional repressor for pyruvate dehydrogenase complex
MLDKKSTVHLKPIAQNSMTELVAKQLLGLLSDGRLAPGDKLPAERELATQLEVGRTTVREALKLLTLSGLLEARRGDGTYVRRDFTNFVLEQITRPLLLSTPQVDMVLEVRLPLEVQAAKLAAERATTEELAEIERLSDLPRSVPRNLREETVTDIALHQAIAAASHNELLVRLMGSMQSILQQYTELSNQMTENNETTVNEHQQISRAISMRDADAAERAMREHLNISHQLILKAFQQQP